MTNFIKLTDKDGYVVYWNPRHIIRFFSQDSGSNIKDIKGSYFQVKETPEEIAELLASDGKCQVKKSVKRPFTNDPYFDAAKWLEECGYEIKGE